MFLFRLHWSSRVWKFLASQSHRGSLEEITGKKEKKTSLMADPELKMDAVRDGHPKGKRGTVLPPVGSREFSFGSNCPSTRSRKRSAIDSESGGDGQVSPQTEIRYPCPPTKRWWFQGKQWRGLRKNMGNRVRTGSCLNWSSLAGSILPCKLCLSGVRKARGHDAVNGQTPG